MTLPSAHHPKAFAVDFASACVWAVSAQHRTKWAWPDSCIVPLAQVLQRKNEVADLEPGDQVRLLTIHFDGSVHPRKALERSEIKGRLFRAEAGNVVFSKIDVRNGAIGLVPDGIDNCCVTSEFPVYSVCGDAVLPEYVKLLFRTGVFMRLLNSMISGASGRKRIQPSQLENIKVPIPQMEIQEAIVQHWHQAEKEREDATRAAAGIPLDLEKSILGELGLKLPGCPPQPKVMSPRWTGLVKWNQRATHSMKSVPELGQGEFPVVSGIEAIREVKHGCSASPSRQPTGLRVLKLNSVTGGTFLPGENKPIEDRDSFRHSFDLRAGDILVCRTNGTLAFVGRPALVPEDQPELIFPDKLMRIRLKPNTRPEYLAYILSTGIARPQIEAYARTAVGNYAIGSEDLYALRFPLPPLPVQDQLVARIQAKHAEIARLESEAAALRERARSEVEEMILGIRPV